MARPKGLPKVGGRQKGTPNKITADLKAAILGAFDEAGGQTYLKKVATTQPAVFCGLLGKVLPTQLTGKDEGPMQFENVSEEARLEAFMAFLEKTKR